VAGTIGGGLDGEAGGFMGFWYIKALVATPEFTLGLTELALMVKS
jgi:hypothetical protein